MGAWLTLGKSATSLVSLVRQGIGKDEENRHWQQEDRKALTFYLSFPVVNVLSLN